MKTAWGQASEPGSANDPGSPPAGRGAPAIVELFGDIAEAPGDARAATFTAAEPDNVLQRARAFAEPLLAGEVLGSGESAMAHADGVATILQAIGAAPSMRAAAYLVHAADVLAKPEEAIAKGWGEHYASLVSHTRRLIQAQRTARAALGELEANAAPNAQQQAAQIERVRKMLLAFSRDLRVVLLRLASRLQTLRFHAQSKRPCPQALARESLQVFAPLANRLGIWPIKWEIEDLAFRFTRPDDYQRIAGRLDERRIEREQSVAAARERLEHALREAGIRAGVQGRPKHLYSIWKKMQGKQLDFERVLDLRALRVIVDDVPACYAALACVHGLWRALPEEFDDYIARPKANGYQSLHTVVLDDRTPHEPAPKGEKLRPLEVQIRTAAMHEHAESGIAAHWVYKEGARGPGAVAARDDAQVAQARKSVLQQLLAWERELSHADDEPGAASGPRDAATDRVYVFTPQAEIVELAAGATPVDFAYAVHTSLGHRCRGARVDGAMVPLNTRLASGQTVEIVSVREGGPSLDWLNPELAILGSARSKAKVRAWFNALAQEQTVARGREAVEKLLQREGRTAMRLDELATRLGFRSAEALFEVVGKDEFSLRNIEVLLRPAEPVPDADELLAQRLSRAPAAAAASPKGGVLVVGVDSLLTGLARCCRPAPPDAIGGYVTRGRGVAVHRADCSNFRHMVTRHAERRIPVAWSEGRGDGATLYPIDLAIEADDRQGLLRDISELFAKAQVNVIGVQTRSLRGTASMGFTVEIADATRLAGVLAQVARVAGVRSARRR